MALTPSTTHGGHPRSRGAPVATDNVLLNTLHPVDVTFELGDLPLALGQGTWRVSRPSRSRPSADPRLTAVAATRTERTGRT